MNSGLLQAMNLLILQDTWNIPVKIARIAQWSPEIQPIQAKQKQSSIIRYTALKKVESSDKHTFATNLYPLIWQYP